MRTTGEPSLALLKQLGLTISGEKFVGQDLGFHREGH